VPGFLAASVTFLSSQHGWVLGTTPCGASSCLAIARTQDGGGTWTSLNPPPTTFSAGTASTGVDGIRFANSLDGWVYGPDLWATQDGGNTWTRITLLGWSAPTFEDLETAAGVVHAVFLDTDQDVAVRIATSPVGSNSWQVSPTAVTLGAGPIPVPQLVVQGSAGWILEDDRVVVGGAHLVGGGWESWKPPCTQVNGPAALAASSSQDLIAVCDQGVWGPASPTGFRAWVSSNGGASFSLLPTAVPDTAAPGPLASPDPSVAALASGSDILATFDGGSTWTTVYIGPASQGIDYLGFTTTTQGVAIELESPICNNSSCTSPAGSLLMTHDGGHEWAPVPI
jgi:photosystem II stability/assembly factor-like uncharacterized protein